MARLRSVRALVIAGVVVAIVAAGLAVASGSDHQQQLPSVPATVDIKTLENHIRDAKKRAAGTDYAGKAKSAANKVVKHQDVVKRRARDIVNDVVQAVMKAHGRRFRVQNAVSDDADLLNTGCLRESAFTSALTSLQSSCVADFDYLTKDDLSGICDTSCFKAIREKLSPFKACLAKNGLLSLVEVVDKCNSARECFSDEYVSKIKNIPVHCVAQMQAAFDFANNTGAAKAMAAEFCSSGCKDRLLDIAQKFPTCAYELGDLDAAARVKAVTDFMAHVCTSADDNSAVCAVQLKMLGNLKCRGDSSSSSSSAAPCADADGWCDLGTCEPAPAQSRLAALCGNCLGGLRRFFEAQHDVYTVAALDMTCATADVTAIGGDSNHAVPYCLAALPDAFGRVAAAGGDAATSQDQHRAVCSGATRSCLERVVHRLADAEERQAYDRLGTCSKETLSCESDFQAQMQKAYDMREDLKAFCTLDSNTGTYCIPLIRNFVSKTQCARDDKCSTECRNDFEAATTEAGCCASELDAALIKDDVMRRRMPFARLRVVDRIYDIASQKVHRRANFVRVGNTFRDDRSTMAANDFAACAGNTTGFWGKFESTCSSSGGSISGANAKVQREAEPTVGPAPDLVAVKIAPGADPTSGGVNARMNANQ